VAVYGRPLDTGQPCDLADLRARWPYVAVKGDGGFDDAPARVLLLLGSLFHVVRPGHSYYAV
jgi:hypothetical protein